MAEPAPITATAPVAAGNGVEPPPSERVRTAAGAPLVVLGIDPGSVVTGYGLVRASGADVEAVVCGAVRPKGAGVAERLVALYDRLRALIAEWPPDEVAIEEPFTRVNAHSAFVLGKAQAVAMLAAAHAGLPVFEYTPAAVKQAVTGYGRGDKAQVQEAVRLQLGLSTAPQPSDAADALAVALCHLAHRRMAALMVGRGRR
jgi:crossover junction endodeoxyribonuclease RuvC